MFFRSKRLFSHTLQGSQKQTLISTWNINIALGFIFMITISIVIFSSFNMISNSMIEHTTESSQEIIKQTANNIQTALEELDDISMTMSRDDAIANRVIDHSTITDENEKKQNIRMIEELLNNYCHTREDFVDVAIITNKDKYISSGDNSKHSYDENVSCYAVKTFNQSGQKSLWLDTYASDVKHTAEHSENGQVFSIIKGIYSSSSLKSEGTLVINIRESHLYSMISNVKLSDESNVFILGDNGNYVMNAQDRTLNGQTAEYEFIDEVLAQKNGSARKVIDKKSYIITYNTIDEIKGTGLGWTIVDMTPVSSITKGITNAGINLIVIGLLCIFAGLIISVVITRVYNSNLDKKYTERHSIDMERERLASLGQMIGGIAHNFKTPIMSISGGLEAISDLINEYDNSIGDDEVTSEDHHEIASEISDWVTKIKPYCSYMSDIMSAVKGQTTNLNDSSSQSFTVEELIKRVKILMSHELKKNKCDLNIDIKVNESAKIAGEINNLVQILNNLISNSIEAYDGEGGKVDLIISKKGNNLEIIEKDYGCGIPENIKEKLLKEMITTKGKNGTGLGLYMSYSTIKGKFQGSMSIESEKGKGTVITISIPFAGKS